MPRAHCIYMNYTVCLSHIYVIHMLSTAQLSHNWKPKQAELNVLRDPVLRSRITFNTISTVAVLQIILIAPAPRLLIQWMYLIGGFHKTLFSKMVLIQWCMAFVGKSFFFFFIAANFLASNQCISAVQISACAVWHFYVLFESLF